MPVERLRGAECMPTVSDFVRRVPGHHYSLGTMGSYMELVLSAPCSGRAAASVLKQFVPLLPNPPAVSVPPVASDPTPLAKCRVTANAAHPLVTEWPASEKAHLQSMAGSQTVAVEYSGCDLSIIDGIDTIEVLIINDGSVDDTVEIASTKTRSGVTARSHLLPSTASEESKKPSSPTASQPKGGRSWSFPSCSTRHERAALPLTQILERELVSRFLGPTPNLKFRQCEL